MELTCSSVCGACPKLASPCAAPAVRPSLLTACYFLQALFPDESAIAKNTRSSSKGKAKMLPEKVLDSPEPEGSGEHPQ